MSSTSTDKPRPAAKRRSAPKSRNGCLTCRARRVKCDEQLPIYQLCQIRPSETLRFIDPREAFYFKVYQDEVCLELSRYSRQSAWSYTLLQACHHEPFVLRAVVAIGALNRAVKQVHFATRGSKDTRKPNLELAAAHRTFALVSYNRAIQGMQRIVPIPQNPSSLRNALISCLLIYCIELFLKAPSTALAQGQNGYTLLQQWLRSREGPSPGLLSPNSNIVDDEIFQEFGRMELYHAQRWGPKDLVRHEKRRQEATSTVRKMPIAFTTLGEATLFQELLMRRTFHLIDESYARNMALKQDLRHPYCADNPGEVIDPCDIPENLLEVRDLYLVDIHRWLKAFEPVLAQSKRPSDPITQLEVALLQAQALDAEICLAGAFFTRECDFDQFLPSFAAIVSLARQVIRIRAQLWTPDLPVFNFPDSIEKPLSGVVAYCRDQTIRHEALSMLRSTAHRDPSHTIARTTTRLSFLVELEERGRLPDGTIPEAARWRIGWVLHHYLETPNDMTILYCRRLRYPMGRAYPAQREWLRRKFTQEEAETMEYAPWDESMHYAGAWAPRRNHAKPGCMAWREVHAELLGRSERARID
ncbi:uncharacterized protein L3040_002447 [Drepanopeziza brunnea f. sp. 'multigermtubi']|uniref:uncharacterized protein n=1 Tax=Drepanopeziza brunnea f. sp. 'multigermtubi' TaxID=698441 RepID=UPI00239AA406|nr:hypothetical protein L3040_002447 [Drepanopeziza brunnea f. sp. 'multigermtubi']